MVIMVGALLASSIGLMLLALVLITMLRSSKRAPRSRPIHISPPVDEENLFPWISSPSVIRGYDTPELYRDDNRSRGSQENDAQSLH
jgi:hypothetical protein